MRDNMFIYASVEVAWQNLFPQFASYSLLLSVMKGFNKCKILKLAFLERVLGPLWKRGICLALQRNNGNSIHVDVIKFNNVRTSEVAKT